MQSHTLPTCPIHKSEPLSWVCLNPKCESRIFCSHCVILNHKSIHDSFNEISLILNDPLYHLVGSEFLLKSDRTKNLSETIASYFESQEDYLRGIMDNLISEINKRFEEIRKEYRNDVENFLKQNKTQLNEFETQRKDYEEFCNNYYTEKDIGLENLKEGMDLVLSKFNSDVELLKNFNEIIGSIPKFKDDKVKEIKFDGIKLKDLNWMTFADKKLKSFNKQIIYDVVWASGGKNLKNTNNYDTTVSSEEPLPEFFKIKIKFVEMNSKDIVIGLTKKKFNCTKSERSYLTDVDGENGEYGYDPKSNGYKFSCKNKQENYGDTCEVGDILSIIYKPDKTISFKRNKKDMGVAFSDAEGPFYLAASIFRNATNLEIISCKAL